MSWDILLIDPAREMLGQIGGFLVSLIKVIFILLIGWLIAKLIKNVVARILQVISLDKVAEKIGANKFLAKGGIGYSLSDLVGLLVYWLVMLIVFVVAINSLNLLAAAELLNRIVLYVPNVIVSIFILVLGMFVATFFGKTVTTAASNAGIGYSAMFGRIVEVVIVIFSIAIALEQLGIGADIIRILIAVTLASFGLGFAIAFGLGCKDLVGKMVADALSKFKK